MKVNRINENFLIKLECCRLRLSLLLCVSHAWLVFSVLYLSWWLRSRVRYLCQWFLFVYYSICSAILLLVYQILIYFSFSLTRFHAALVRQCWSLLLHLFLAYSGFMFLECIVRNNDCDSLCFLFQSLLGGKKIKIVFLRTLNHIFDHIFRFLLIISWFKG